jgi:hypothetical protein
MNQWKPQKTKVKYPRWTFVYIPEENEYSLIWDKTRLIFISERAFKSWNKIPIIASKESVSGYKIWKRIGFAPGTLIESIVDKKRYFITGGKLFEEEKMLVGTPDFYEKLGFNPSLAIIASIEEVNFHKEGEIISDIRSI